MNLFLSTVLFLFVSSAVCLMSFYVLSVLVERVERVRSRRTADHFNARVLYGALSR